MSTFPVPLVVLVVSVTEFATDPETDTDPASPENVGCDTVPAGVKFPLAPVLVELYVVDTEPDAVPLTETVPAVPVKDGADAVYEASPVLTVTLDVLIDAPVVSTNFFRESVSPETEQYTSSPLAVVELGSDTDMSVTTVLDVGFLTVVVLPAVPTLIVGALTEPDGVKLPVDVFAEPVNV